MNNRILIGKCVKDLKFRDDYDDYNSFYDEHREDIYKAIIYLFDVFKTSNRKVLSIKVTATIAGIFWTTELVFNKDQFYILNRDILPFFEENEKYDICSEIVKLSKELTTC